MLLSPSFSDLFSGCFGDSNLNKLLGDDSLSSAATTLRRFEGRDGRCLSRGIVFSNSLMAGLELF